MNKIFRLFFLLTFALGNTVASAQTLAQAKSWYGEGDYEKAKPVFARYVKSYPNNGNYNLWYGVCCLRTGHADEAVAYLEKAVKRRTPSGQLYLGQTYNELYRYEEAIKTFEAYIADLAKRKRSTAEADSLLAISRLGLRLLRGVEEVQVIDSFVVDKQALPGAYRLSPESGTLSGYEDYFGQKGKGGTVYENELGNRMYYSALQADSTLQIFASNKLLDKWGQGKALPENINERGANANYPYMLSDGMTLYYASDGKESLGGYDIFVTRYNTNTDTYLTPENVGMPFNSPYNDYLYAIDEFNHLGWFASDRYQPEGKVCIYIFIPNASKQVYDYESMERDQLLSLARLDSIAATWRGNMQDVAAAKERLQVAMQGQQDAKQQRHYDFTFVIDDTHTYHSLDDFRSTEARESYRQYAQSEENLRKQYEKLDALREQYLAADPSGKADLTPAILDLEQLTRRLDAEVRKAAIEVRRLEKQHQL